MMGDIKVYEPYIRALLGTASQFCKVVVLKSRTVIGLDPEDRQKSLRYTVAYQATPNPYKLNPKP